MTKVIFIIGPPGSGKGTQCQLLAEKTGFIHISTGDMCREAIDKGTEFGKKIEPFLRETRFVPDELIIDVIKARLQEPDARAKGVLLDGFPRTIRQARALIATGAVEVERFILFQASDDICVERVFYRRSDPITGRIYNLKTAPPPQEIEKRLVRRDMDKEEKKIRVRLEAFKMQLGQVLLCFPGRIQAVSAGKSPPQVFAELQALLSEPVPSPITLSPASPKPKGKKKQKQRKQQPVPSQQCVVCMDRAAEFLLIPCGHQCGCEECLTVLHKNRGNCPICRQHINGLVRVYQSGVIENEDKGEFVPEDEVDDDLQPDVDDGGWGAEAQKQLERMKLGEGVEGGEIKISVAPCEDVEASGGKVNTAISIECPDIRDRVPIDICCVVDVSGSMGEEAKFQDPNDEKKTRSEGMNQLDLVKHSVKTIMYTLAENDRLAVIAFSSKARIAFPLTPMDENGRRRAVVALEALEPLDQTNIWAGLLSGLDALREPSTKLSGVRNRSIILLTDGQPNVSPPQGESKALETYFETHPGFGCQVNTFGFGYSLDSKLLTNIAATGKGTFAFIPDAKIVGTCFVNAVANISSMLSPNCLVHLQLRNNTQWGQAQMPGCYPVDTTSWGRVVHLGPLHYGQTRDLVVSLQLSKSSSYSSSSSSSSSSSPQSSTSDPPRYNLPFVGPYLEVTVEYQHGDVQHKVTALGSNFNVTPDATAAFVRNHLVSVATDVIQDLEKGRPTGLNKMKALVGTVGSFQAAAGRTKDGRLDGMYQDVSGRMSKAISTVERFHRWGKHYLLALVRSHQLQLRTNFMDPGLQVYGGGLFRQLEDQGGKIFVTLPMKKYSDNMNGPARGGPPPGAAPARAVPGRAPPTPVLAPVAPANNVTYYEGGGGGCFGELSTVLVLRTSKNGVEFFQETFVKDVRQHDIVKVVDHLGVPSSATVRCVVQLKCGVRTEIVRFIGSDLKITPRHPIRVNGQWSQPKDFIASGDAIVETAPDLKSYLYNFVLDRCHILEVNGVGCCTLGHGLQDPGVTNSFYGEAVLATLAKKPGWDTGFVAFEGSSLRA